MIAGGVVVEDIKMFRTLLGFTSLKMAKELGISKSLYEKVEYGHKKPSREFITKFKTRFPFIDTNIFFKLK
jgi:transcriptional regulator with XRE-family HTH domain